MALTGCELWACEGLQAGAGGSNPTAAPTLPPTCEEGLAVPSLLLALLLPVVCCCLRCQRHAGGGRRASSSGRRQHPLHDVARQGGARGWRCRKAGQVSKSGLQARLLACLRARLGHDSRLRLQGLARQQPCQAGCRRRLRHRRAETRHRVASSRRSSIPGTPLGLLLLLLLSAVLLRVARRQRRMRRWVTVRLLRLLLLVQGRAGALWDLPARACTAAAAAQVVAMWALWLLHQPAVAGSRRMQPCGRRGCGCWRAAAPAASGRLGKGLVLWRVGGGAC